MDQICTTNDLTCRSIAGWIKARAPAATAVAVGSIVPCDAFDAAEAGVTSRAVPSRRDEFHTGRRLARIALAELGCPSVSIPVGPARLPTWPESYLGSISHTRAICIAHVARSRDMLGLGVDLEPDLPIDAIMAETICRADETTGAIGPTLGFVAKEAFYKAYFPITRTFLEFHDVRVELDPDAGRFEARLMGIDKPSIMGRRSFVGHYSRIAGQFVAAVWILP